MTTDGSSYVLSQEIARRTGEGWILVSQTGNGAQMRKPKQFSFVWAFIWFLLLVFGLLIYLVYYIAKNDELVYLSVQDGVLSVTKS